MAFEEILTAQLETVSGLSGKVEPINIPQGTSPPYAIYMQRGGAEFEELVGFTGCKRNDYEINILHTTYKAMKDLTALVIAKLKTMQGTTYSGTLVQAVFFDENSPEMWEDEVNLCRKIIFLTIIY